MKDMSVEELLEIVSRKLMFDFEYYDKAKAELLRRFEALECCGNCGVESQLCYKVNGTIIIKQPKYHYCGNYKPDGLTREERSK